MKERTFRPTTPWIAAAVTVALCSLVASVFVRSAVSATNEDRFAVAVDAVESELSDRLSGFQVISVILPVAMNPDMGGVSVDTVQGFMAGEGVASIGAVASIMSAFPLDGFTALAFVARNTDGALAASMLPNNAGLDADAILLPGIAEAVQAALSSSRPVTSPPLTIADDRDSRYVHVTPVNDGLAAVAFINASKLLGGSIASAGAQLVHVEVIDELAATTVVDTGASSRPQLRSAVATSLFEREWIINATPGPDFGWQDPGLPGYATLVMGMLIAALLYAVGVQTRRRTLEQREQLRLAREINTDKDRFIAAVSHELRTPLTSIVGLAQEMADAPDRFAIEEIGELTGIMAQQSNEMALLVEDLLVAARTQAGTVTVHPEPIDLAVQVRMIIDGLGDHAGRVSVRGGGHAWADPLRVRQIVRNLITNALRHGGPSIRIDVRAGADAAYVEVSDDGPEIPDEARRKMFEPYYRSAVTRGQAPSVGLGLSVSRELATLMDGRIWYRYREGRSAFILGLPLVLVERPANVGDATR